MPGPLLQRAATVLPERIQPRIRNRIFRLVLLGEVKLVLLLEPRAGVVLTQGPEGQPILGELLRDTTLGRDD